MDHYKPYNPWVWDPELNIYSKVIRDLGRLEVRPKQGQFEIVLFLHDPLFAQPSYQTSIDAMRDADLWVAQLAEDTSHSTRIALDTEQRAARYERG